MATLFNENQFEAEIDKKVKTIVKNELPKTGSYRAVVVRKDSEGTWWVRIDGNDEETPVLVTKVDMSVGDVVTVTISDHVTMADGNITSPAMSAFNAQNYVDSVVAKSIKAVSAEISYLKADTATIGYAQIEDADITNARIQNLVAEVTSLEGHFNTLEANALTASSAVITDLQSDTAKIENLTALQLEATVGYIETLSTGDLDAASLLADHAEVTNLDANYAHLTNGVIDNATIGHADVNGLNANYAHVSNGAIDNATIGHANVTGLDANYAHLTNGVIDNATIGHASVSGLNANYAHVSNGVIDNATIGYADVDGLAANYATISTLQSDYITANIIDATYTKTDFSNANVSWIQNGVIKDAAITDAQILGVSANKLTAGTIDASNINVSNLRADTLIVNRINGQPVIGGYVAVDSSASGYSSTNPSTQGWYEISNGSMVLSQDTSVNASKAYYTASSSVSLYDQTYIDNLEEALNDRIDGAIETFTGTTVPTLNNYPASGWDTNDVRDTHVGDVYFVVNSTPDTPGYEQNGYNYRFTKTGSGASAIYSWQLIKDSDVTNALSRLSTAEGSIVQFSTDISTLQTDVGTLTTQTQSLETSLGDKVDVTTFNAVADDVSSHTQTISTFSDVLTNNGLTTSTNITSTVSEVSQTATGASTKISQLTQTLGTNADGTTKTGDIVHRVASTETGLDSITTRVGKTEAHLSGQYAVSSTADDANAKTATIVPAVSNWTLETGHTVTVKFEHGNDAEEATVPTLNVNQTGAKAIKDYAGNDLTTAAKEWQDGTALTFVYDGTYWRLQDSSMTERVTQAETLIEQTADNVLIKASRTGATNAEKEAGGNAVIQSLINVAPEGVKIDASKVDITGTAVFNAINNDTGQTKIDGGKIDATSITIGATTLPESILRYCISYEYDEDPTTHEKVSATFTAHLYQGDTDIKTSYPESCFTWYLKSENWVQGEPMTPLSSNDDYTCTLLLEDVGYGATVVGHFDPPSDAIALDGDDDTLTDDDDTPISVRVPSGDYVRIADLTAVTTVFDADKMLLVTSDGEKLATVETLKDVFGTASYENLDDLPTIEGVTLLDDKSFPDLGIFKTDSQGYDVPDDYTLSTMDINALWANAQPIGG